MTSKAEPRITEPPAFRWLGRVAYGLFVSFAGVGAAFLIVLVTGPLFSNGESWQAFALGWWVFGVPIALFLGAASAAVVYPLYIRLLTWPALGAACVSNVLIVAAVILWAAAWGAGI